MKYTDTQTAHLGSGIHIAGNTLAIATYLLLLLCVVASAGAIGQRYQPNTQARSSAPTTTITTIFFDQGTVYAPALIVSFGRSGLPSKMRFTLQHPNGSLQDVYCIRPYLGVCNSVYDPSMVGSSIGVSGIINPIDLEWDARNLTIQ